MKIGHVFSFKKLDPAIRQAGAKISIDESI